MTKAEELKLLEQIDGLINSAGADSYICDTFAGIVEVCRENIRNDWGIHPVEDSRIYLDQKNAEIRMHDETKRMLANAQSIASKAIDERDKYAVQVAELRKELEQVRKDFAEYRESTETFEDKQEDTIMRLKAELYDYMRKEREQ